MTQASDPSSTPDDPAPTPSMPSAPAATAIPSIDSADLLQNHQEIAIRHGTETYRLRLTRSGKLILHK